MPRLRICVCTNRAPAVSLPCLRELAEQGLNPADLVLVGSGGHDRAAAAHEQALATALPGARVLAEPRPGLSVARNRALAASEEGDVVAFLDDDAIPGGGWLEAMREAWEAAPA